MLYSPHLGWWTDDNISQPEENEGIGHPVFRSNSEELAMTIVIAMENTIVWAYFGYKTMPVLLDTGASFFLLSLQAYTSLPSYVTLQRNKVSEAVTCTYAFVLKSDRKAVFDFKIGGYYFAQIFVQHYPFPRMVILRCDLFQAHNLTMTWLENGHVQLIHRSRVLYISGVE